MGSSPIGDTILFIMNSKEKGNIGESVILSEFIKKGVQVSIPFGDNARYDLIADFGGKLNKIQVKYCSSVGKNNSICCRTASSTNHTTNKCLNTYENDVDYIAFYLSENNKCYLVPITDIGKRKSFQLRIDKAKNGQTRFTHLAEDYEFSKIIP